MKTDLSETIRETGRRGELEQEKLFCLLLEMLGKMRQELAEDPTYRKTLDMERLQTITDSFRIHMNQGRDLFDQLNGWMQRIERSAYKGSAEETGCKETDSEDAGSEYPVDTLYHMAVAEQEQELRRLYPSRFGME